MKSKQERNMELIAMPRSVLRELTTELEELLQFTDDASQIYAPIFKRDRWLDYQRKLDEFRNRVDFIASNFRPVRNGDIYLSGEEVCELLHITKQALQQYRDDEILPYVQAGGKIIYRQPDILSILKVELQR